MDNSFLKGKTIVITGSVKGIGKALAKMFVANGATVALHYRKSQKEAEKLLGELQKINSACRLYQADLTVEEDVVRMFTQIYKDFKKVDVLINGVGNFIYKPIDKLSAKEFRDEIESNLYSVFYCSQQVLPRMKKEEHGQIINFATASADRMMVRSYATPYYIAKAGVIMLSKDMALRYGPFGIRINVIAPGITEDSSVKNIEVPLGRYASFEDLANAIFFLLQPGSDYINGTTIEVSGGWIPGFS